jgi:RNase P/RNase MRP subunit p29
MHWPDIFFKAKKPKPEPELPPPFQPTPDPATAQVEAQPPAIKPVPASARVASPPNPAAEFAPAPPPTPTAVPAPMRIDPKPIATPTIPATHGVVLRPPTGRTLNPGTGTPQFAPPRALTPPRPSEPLKNIEQLMAEADPVQTLRQTGNVRILKPLNAAETGPVDSIPVAPIAKPAPVKSEVVPPIAVAPVSAATPSSLPLPTPTAAKAASLSPSPETRKPLASKPEPEAVPAPAISSSTPPATASSEPMPEENDSPFILKPGFPAAAIPRVLPPTAPAITPLGSIFRRKARMADVARIVLPPKREDSQQLHPLITPQAEPSPTVVPPAFPVAAMTARATQHLPKVATSEPVEATSPEKIVTESKPAAPNSSPITEAKDTSLPTPAPVAPAPAEPSPATKAEAVKPESPWLDKTPEITTKAEKPTDGKAEPPPTRSPASETKPVEPLLASPDAPKVDPEAHRAGPSALPQPKVDPEAHKPKPKDAAPSPVERTLAQPDTSESAATPGKSSDAPAPEKREFHLANGERVAGTVLSETAEAVYIEHATLGVLTIPRAHIAKRLVEIILINGDRIVGDIMAETADTLYVRHASLGMLTVPRAQRSTRVVEAILKDGDRILGEVLTETDTFTVIRSATLGTITVPHTKLAMLNRKVEQVEMKSLPPPAPELKDKSPK